MENLEEDSLYPTLLNALITGGLEPIAQAAFDYLKHPFILVDAEYNRLVQIPNEPIGDMIWDSIWENDGVPLNLLQLFSDEHLLQKNYNSNKSFFANWGSLEKCPRILSNISVKNSIVGYTATLYLHDACTEHDLAAIDLISQVFAIEFQRQNLHVTEVHTMWALFLTNLFEGKIKNHKDLAQWKLYTKHSLNRDFCVVAAQPYKGTSEQSSLPYIRKSIESFYPLLHPVISDEYLYFLLSDISSNHSYKSELKSLVANLADYNLHIGVSYRFSDVLDIGIYKDQATLAVANGSSSADPSHVYFYQDCALGEFFLGASEHMNKQNYLHPAIHELRDYDKEKNTDYLHTLSVYILSMCNASETLKQLHIHRNTLPYRLRAIEKIANLDLNDARTCAHLLCSFYLLQYAE
jgi:hypothetical protein